MGDSSAADPLHRRIVGQLAPEVLNARRIFAHQQRLKGVRDAAGDQSIRGRVAVRPRVTAAADALVRANDHPRGAPLRDLMRAVCYSLARDRDVEYERL